MKLLLLLLLLLIGLTCSQNIYSEIISLFDGKCLDVLNNSNEDETNVQVYDCNGSDAQKWIYLPSTKEIKNINGKCLDLLYNDNSDGANIQIYHCTGNNNGAQMWDIDPETGYIFNSINNNICINIGNADNNVNIWSCNGSPVQKFDTTQSSKKIKYFSSNFSNYCIDILYETNVALWSCIDDYSQNWHFVESTHEIRSVEKQNKCLDILYNNNNDGTNIQVYDCIGSEAQIWYYVPLTKQIKNINGKCLNLIDNDLTNGANIELWSCNDTADSQKWILE